MRAIFSFRSSVELKYKERTDGFMDTEKTAVITDSCADLSPAALAGKPVFILPLVIHCQDGTYRDGVDISAQDIYQRLKTELPKTSLPSGDAVEQVLTGVWNQGYRKAIAITLSSGLSGTYNLMRLVEKYIPELELEVIDSLSGSLGTGATVLQAAEYIEQGMPWSELISRVRGLVPRTHAFFSVDTLEYLQKGGRIGKVTATAGTLLQIKPILTFAGDGQLQSAAKVRGRNQVMDKLVDLTVKSCGAHRRYNLAVANGGAAAEMETVRQKLTAALPHYDHIWDGEIDGTLSVYIGDGVLGAAVQVLD
jgi:DegV family protein with EDD domain